MLNISFVKQYMLWTQGMISLMHMISYPLFAQAAGNQYINDLLVIYDRLATFTQMGAYLVASAERGVALGQEVFPAVNASVAGAALVPYLKVSGNRFGNWHAVTLPPARRFSSAWSPTSQPSSSSAPTGGPPISTL
jgi:hypothetical protein